MKKYLLILLFINAASALKAQTNLYNLNNHAYYSRFYDYSPKFPVKLFTDLADKMKYTKAMVESLSGELIIHAVIDTTGKVGDALVVRSVSPEVDEEAMLAMTHFPKVQPGMYKGKTVPAFFVIVMDIEVDAKKHTLKVSRNYLAVTRELKLGLRAYDKAPAFKYANGNLLKYINDNIAYPSNVKTTISDNFVMSLDIDSTGTIANMVVTKPISKDIDQSVLDVMAKAPKFTPASMNHKNVSIHIGLKLIIDVNTEQKTIIATSYKAANANTTANFTAYIDGTDTSTVKQVLSDTTIYSAAQVNPHYPDGDAEFSKYLAKHILYPANSRTQRIQGQVFVQFIVEQNGVLSNIRVMRTPADDLGTEAIRVIKEAGAWVPATQNGKHVRVLFTVPIMFRL